MASSIARFSMRSSESTQIEPFRFTDLPREIRDNIYYILLCADDSSQIPKGSIRLSFVFKLHLGIEPQILWTCRTIYMEAIYIMRQSNLFIKLTFKMPRDFILDRFLADINLPVLKLYNETDGNCFVMSHEIVDTDTYVEHHHSGDFPMIHSYDFLYRDFSRFTEVLSFGQISFGNHNERIRHTVTLLDPYDHETLYNDANLLLNCRKFFQSHNLQKILLPLYATALRGFNNFIIQGAVEEDLRTAIMTDICASPIRDRKILHEEVCNLKETANNYFRAKNLAKADELYLEALVKLFSFLAAMGKTDEAWDRLRTIDNGHYLAEFAQLHFLLTLNQAQLILISLRQESAAGSDKYSLKHYAQQLFIKLGICEDFESTFRGTTWQPSPKHKAKLLFKRAVGLRIFGEPLFIPKAEDLLRLALQLVPEDKEILREKGRIEKWKASIRNV
jgi:hypothetical protein